MWHYAAGYTIDEEGERSYGVYEVYDTFGGGTWTTTPTAAWGIDIDGLVGDLLRMAKDVMSYDEFEVT